MEATIPIKLRSYRAFKHPWVGHPTKSPAIHTEAVALQDSIITVVHVSWNGDTRTAKWEFHGIDDRGDVHQLGSIKRQGFETRFEYRGFASQVFAEAIDVNGNRLGKSDVADTAWPALLKKIPSPAGSTLDAQPEQSSVSQGPLTYGDPYSASASADSFLKKPGKTFEIGIACGAAFIVLIWTCARLFKKCERWSLWQARETRYMPLQQDMD